MVYEQRPNNAEQGSINGIVLIDLSKAFGLVVVVANWNSMALLRQMVLRWFKSFYYLNERYQLVQIASSLYMQPSSNKG